jgi:hypothetical protein
MATFTIDDKEYETENLTNVQKRIVGLYQEAVKRESTALTDLELARACRIELGRKLREEIIDSDAQK